MSDSLYVCVGRMNWQANTNVWREAVVVGGGLASQKRQKVQASCKLRKPQIRNPCIFHGTA